MDVLEVHRRATHTVFLTFGVALVQIIAYTNSYSDNPILPLLGQTVRSFPTLGKIFIIIPFITSIFSIALDLILFQLYSGIEFTDDIGSIKKRLSSICRAVNFTHILCMGNLAFVLLVVFVEAIRG